MDLGKKIMVFIGAEIFGTFFFVFLIILVSTISESMPNYPLTAGTIVFIWAVYGFVTPLVIFNDVVRPFFEGITDLLDNLR